MTKPSSLPSSSLLPTVTELLIRYARDADTGWSCGTFGAIAEFARMRDEPVQFFTGDGIVAATARGGIRVAPIPGLRPIAYELTSRDPALWQQGVALCLPLEACSMARITTVTELGPDENAIRPQDREAILFDLGLNELQADICVRTSDPATLEVLRAGVGRPLLELGNLLRRQLVALSPHRVFRCRFGRVEVYQGIPPEGGVSPDGPHTHLLPKLLVKRRSHAANLPIPAGWVPCMTIHPPNPMRESSGRLKPFDADQHMCFQALWQQFGQPELVALKAATIKAICAGRRFDMPQDRWGRVAVSVAQRQLRQLGHPLSDTTSLLGHLS